jgi:hypothetical protein
MTHPQSDKKNIPVNIKQPKLIAMYFPQLHEIPENGVRWDIAFINSAENFIQLNPAQYLDNSRITKAIGNFDEILDTLDSG